LHSAAVERMLVGRLEINKWRFRMRESHCHRFSQNLVFRLDLLFQIGDSFLFRLMLSASLCWKAVAPFSKNSFCQR
jgi:hypothetical protein